MRSGSWTRILRRPAGRRLGLITIDTAISGGSNVVVTALAARMLSVDQFGQFALLFMIFGLMMGTCRALVSGPILIHPQEVATRAGEVIGTVLVLAFGLGGLQMLVAPVVGEVAPSFVVPLLILGACTPFLLVQEAGRVLGLAQQRPARAIELDLAWLILVVLALAVLQVERAVTVPLLISAWVLTGSLSGLLTFRQHPLSAVRLGLRWLRQTWTYSYRYFLSFLAVQVAGLIAIVVLRSISSEGQAGASGALLLLSPFMIVLHSSVDAATTHIARDSDRAQVWRHAVLYGMLPTALAIVYGIFLILLPSWLGREILGATWPHTRELLVPASLQMVTFGLWTGARAGLSGTKAVRTSQILDFCFLPILLVAALVGAKVGGAAGYFWFGVAVNFFGVVWWWVVLARHLRSWVGHAEPHSDEGPATVDRPSQDP